jgi:hypothetical protein
VFDERVFFDFDDANPRPESKTVIQLVAESMKRDVPDAALTILGHTDAVGTDPYNVALSQRRASSVLGELIDLGLNPNQLSTVAIGKAQPIAPNATEDGRARNRRVEFLISGSEEANLSVVRNRTINADFFRLEPSQIAKPLSGPVQVLKPVRRSDGGISLGPSGLLTLRPAEPAPSPIVPTAAEKPTPNQPTSHLPRPLAPQNPVVPRAPEPVLPAPLHDPAPANF